MPEFKIKRFKELTTEELYQILRLRSEVFVVEQNCVYQDIDNKDLKALHLVGEYNGKIVAYARLFEAGDYFDNASIGRVVIDAGYRDRKWGHILIQSAIEGIAVFFNQKAITISAQLYLRKFYETNGFVALGEVYDEDGIPHIQMEKV